MKLKLKRNCLIYALVMGIGAGIITKSFAIGTIAYHAALAAAIMMAITAETTYD